MLLLRLNKCKLNKVMNIQQAPQRGPGRPRGQGGQKGPGRPRGQRGLRGPGRPRGQGGQRGPRRPRGQRGQRGLRQPRGQGQQRNEENVPNLSMSKLQNTFQIVCNVYLKSLQQTCVKITKYDIFYKFYIL